MSEEINVEIVDDTPPEDRNRAPMPKNLVEELEKDDLEEYSDKVKKRLSQLKKVWHDERRAKEAAAREREQALTFAQQAYEENRQLKQRLTAGEQLFATETTEAASIKLQAAKEALKRAFEAGDADKIAEAQTNLTDAQLHYRDRSSFKPSLQERENSVQNQPTFQAPQSAPQPVDRKAEEWKANNTWFGEDEEMTALALGTHRKLVRSGVDPTSDDYYRRVDDVMRKRFPDYFGDEETQTPEREPERVARKVSTVVAPATRSTSSRRVQLTTSEAAIAKKLGLTPEAYAREKMKIGE
jgi:hypothetical protein